MKSQRDRELGQRARPARNMIVAALTELRAMLHDDRLYEAALWQIEGWIMGQRAWLTAVARQEAERVDSGVGKHEDCSEAGRVSLPLVGSHDHASEREQRGESGQDPPPLGL